MIHDLLNRLKGRLGLLDPPDFNRIRGQIGGSLKCSEESNINLIIREVLRIISDPDLNYIIIPLPEDVDGYHPTLRFEDCLKKYGIKLLLDKESPAICIIKTEYTTHEKISD